MGKQALPQRSSGGGAGRGGGHCDYIEFCKHGDLRSSWGGGAWSFHGLTMEVSFPRFGRKLRLLRTPSGFVALQSEGKPGVACAHGYPLAGNPDELGVVPGLLQRFAVIALLRLRLPVADQAL